ncbi:MAG: hypothetical protein R3F04_09765 [Lysobacteraceae bacterium]
MFTLQCIDFAGFVQAAAEFFKPSEGVSIDFVERFGIHLSLMEFDCSPSPVWIRYGESVTSLEPSHVTR